MQIIAKRIRLLNEQCYEDVTIFQQCISIYDIADCMLLMLPKPDIEEVDTAVFDFYMHILLSKGEGNL